MNNKLISHLACRYVVVTFLFFCSACSRPVDHMAIEVSSLGEGKNRVEVTLGMVMPLAKAPPWGDDATLVGKVVDQSLATPKSDWAILPVQGVAAHVSIDQVTLHPLPGKKDGQYPSYELSDAVTVHRPPESFGDSPHALLIVLEQGLPIGLLEARHARSNPYTAQELADAAVDYLKKSQFAQALLNAQKAVKLEPAHQDALSLAAAILAEQDPSEAENLYLKLTQKRMPLEVPAEVSDKVTWLLDHGIKAKRYDLVVAAMLESKRERSTQVDMVSAWKEITASRSPDGRGVDGTPPGMNPPPAPEVHTWLPNRGLRGLWNKVRNKIDLSDLEKMSGMPLFVSGPHQGNRIHVNSGNSFGHYNPEFIKWFRNTMIPLLTADRVAKVVKPGYDNSLKNLGRAYAAAYRHVASSPDQSGRIARDYQRGLEGAPPSGGESGYELQERFRGFSDAQDSAGLDWYETNTAAGFWIRRFIDGTHSTIHQGLMELLKVYDRQTYSKYHKDYGPEIDDACMNSCMGACHAECVDEGEGDNCGGGCQDTCMLKCPLASGVPTLIPHETHPKAKTCPKEMVQRDIFGEELRREEHVPKESAAAKTKMRMCDSADTEVIRKNPNLIPKFDEATTRFVRCSVVSFEAETGYHLVLEFGEDTFNTHTVMAVEVKPSAEPRLVFSTHESAGGKPVSVRALCDADGDGRAEVLTVSQTWKTLPEFTLFALDALKAVP